VATAESPICAVSARFTNPCTNIVINSQKRHQCALWRRKGAMRLLRNYLQWFNTAPTWIIYTMRNQNNLPVPVLAKPCITEASGGEARESTSHKALEVSQDSRGGQNTLGGGRSIEGCATAREGSAPTAQNNFAVPMLAEPNTLDVRALNVEGGEARESITPLETRPTGKQDSRGGKTNLSIPPETRTCPHNTSGVSRGPSTPRDGQSPRIPK
jgi:hypothetical protein